MGDCVSHSASDVVRLRYLLGRGEQSETVTVTRRRAVLIGAAFLIAGLGVVGALGFSSKGGEPAARVVAEPEPQLDGSVSLDRRRSRTDQQPSAVRPTVVQALPPGGRTARAATSEEEVPKHILRENASLRRQVDHLEALEREQARVARALGGASGLYDGPLQLGPGGLAWPVGGPVVSPFGQRWGRLHAGVDIAAPAGTVIRASGTGVVAISGPVGGYGNYVCVQHTASLSTCYAHLSRFLTRKGATVAQGQPIGLVGCTGHCFGDHLHFETRVGGQPVDPGRYF